MNHQSIRTHRHRRSYDLPGHAHELTFSSYQGFKFLAAERACQWLAEAIESARQEFVFDLWCYVFMPEHVHLIVRPRTNRYTAGDIRHAIKSPVDRKAIKYLENESPEWLPRITRRRGSKQERLFWQSGGGYDRNVVDGGTLMKMIDYIHMNPVRRGLVSQAKDWKWSSALWYVEGKESPIVPDPIPPEWMDMD